MLFFTKHKLYINIILLLLFLGALWVGRYSALNYSKKTTIEPEKILIDAKEINKKCDKKTNHDECFAREFYILAKKTNATYAISILTKLQELNPKNTRGCHVIAHKISQAQTEKDPQNWENTLKKVPTSMCTGGFMHGVLETHISTNPEFKINEKSITHICRGILKDASGGIFVERSCSHNLGHLLLVQNDNNLKQTIDTCNRIEDREFHYQCLSGSFMERLTADNLIAHDIITSKPQWNRALAQETEKICSTYIGQAERACWNELSYVYISLSNYEPHGLYSECQRAPSQERREDCYIYGAGNLVNTGRIKPENLTKICHFFSENNPAFNYCMVQTLSSLLLSTTDNLDKTINICEYTYDSYRHACYSQIIETLTDNGAATSILQKACSRITGTMSISRCKGKFSTT